MTAPERLDLDAIRARLDLEALQAWDALRRLTGMDEEDLEEDEVTA